MSEIGAIAPIGEAGLTQPPLQITVTQLPQQTANADAAESHAATDASFGNYLADAVATLDGKVAEADRMVTQFVVDESTPIHQVTIALEEARLAVELATQIRRGLTESYREIMNMQL